MLALSPVSCLLLMLAPWARQFRDCLSDVASSPRPQVPAVPWEGWARRHCWDRQGHVTPLTLGWITMVAMSDFLSMSWMVASYASPFCSCTFSCCRPEAVLELDTTWALVMINPASDMMKPEPLDSGTFRPNRGCLRRKARGIQHGGVDMVEGAEPRGVKEHRLGGPLRPPPGFELRQPRADMALPTLKPDPVHGHKDVTVISDLQFTAVRQSTTDVSI